MCKWIKHITEQSNKSSIWQMKGPCHAPDRWDNHIMHQIDWRTMSYISQIRRLCQASINVQVKTSCRNKSYLRVHEVSNYKTPHVGSYIRIDMHIDKRHSWISMRATHLYLDKHIMSWMMNNNWSPGDIHCYSSYRYNSLSIRRRSFSYSNIRSFSYSNDLSCNHVKKSLKLTVVVDGNKFSQNVLYLRIQYYAR